MITEQAEIVERLLKAGCDPTLVDDSGNTALHIACRKGSLTCFSVLTQTQGCSTQLPAIMATPNYSGKKGLVYFLLLVSAGREPVAILKLSNYLIMFNNCSNYSYYTGIRAA